MLVGNGILLGDKIDKYSLDSRHATKHLGASFLNCAPPNVSDAI